MKLPIFVFVAVFSFASVHGFNFVDDISSEILNNRFLINDLVDNLMPQMATLVMKQHVDRIQLPDLAEPAAPIFINVFASNMSTMYRTGDCYMWANGVNTSLELHLGLNDFHVEVENCPYMDSGFTWDITGSATRFAVTLYPNNDHPNSPDDCKTSVDAIEITDIGRIVQHSPNANFDGKTPNPQIVEMIKPFYNKVLNKPEILAKIGQVMDLCQAA